MRKRESLLQKWLLEQSFARQLFKFRLLYKLSVSLSFCFHKVWVVCFYYKDMAFKTQFVYLMFMLVLLFLVAVVVVEEASAGCYAEQRCFSPKPASSLEIQSRKVLQLVSKGVTGNGDEMAVGELRTAPSGPDPLHHNGATPKKPKTP